DFTYRLSIHTQPYLAYIFPLGGRRGTAVEATLGGRLLSSATGAALYVPVGSGAVKGKPSGEQAHVGLTIKADAALGSAEIRLRQGNYLSNPVRFDVGDLPEFFETEPNDQAAQANPVAWPVAINGQLNRPGDVDAFKFSAKKGERLFFEVRAHQ